jgi:hypothetical protein
MLKDMVRPVAPAIFQEHLTILLRECNFVELLRIRLIRQSFRGFVFHQMSFCTEMARLGRDGNGRIGDSRIRIFLFRHSLY